MYYFNSLNVRSHYEVPWEGVRAWPENIIFHVCYSYILIDEDFMSKNTFIFQLTAMVVSVIETTKIRRSKRTSWLTKGCKTTLSS